MKDAEAFIPGFRALRDLAGLLFERDLDRRAEILTFGPDAGALGLDARGPEWRVAAAERLDAQPGAGSFDGAVAFQALSRLSDQEKGAALTEIARALKPKAPVIVIDVFGDKGSTEFARMADAWRNWRFLSGANPSVVEDTFSLVLSDSHVLPEDRLAGLLEDAGFGPPEPFFRALLFGGWLSRRTAP